LAEAYAIGAIAGEEARAFEAHLATCPDCLRVVREQRELAVLLAEAAPLAVPSPGLRERLLARVREERRLVRPFRKRDWTWGLAWAAAVAGLLLAGGGLWRARRAATALAEVETRLARREAMLNAVLDASTAMYRLRPTADSLLPAGAQLFWSRDQHVWLLHAFHLPRLPAGRVYQLWFVTASSKISAGVLDPDSLGRALLRVDVPAAAAASQVAAITVEPAGGSPQPTGGIVFAGSLAATE
jgi:anti-sigma-K factor RskA